MGWQTSNQHPCSSGHKLFTQVHIQSLELQSWQGWIMLTSKLTTMRYWCQSKVSPERVSQKEWVRVKLDTSPARVGKELKKKMMYKLDNLPGSLPGSLPWVFAMAKTVPGKKSIVCFLASWHHTWQGKSMSSNLKEKNWHLIRHHAGRASNMPGKLPCYLNFLARQKKHCWHAFRVKQCMPRKSSILPKKKSILAHKEKHLMCYMGQR